jgi:hypothetical protein
MMMHEVDAAAAKITAAKLEADSGEGRQGCPIHGALSKRCRRRAGCLQAPCASLGCLQAARVVLACRAADFPDLT